MNAYNRRRTDKSPISIAKSELEAEAFEKQVQIEKQKLLTKKPWYDKLFPYSIKIERRN